MLSLSIGSNYVYIPADLYVCRYRYRSRLDPQLLREVGELTPTPALPYRRFNLGEALFEVLELTFERQIDIDLFAPDRAIDALMAEFPPAIIRSLQLNISRPISSRHHPQYRPVHQRLRYCYVQSNRT